MKIIAPSHEILSDIDGAKMLRNIELCGRVCYKSEDRITDGSAEKFVGMILKSGHESVLEHEKIGRITFLRSSFFLADEAEGNSSRTC